MKQKKVYFDGKSDGPIPVKILRYTEITFSTARKQRYVELTVTQTIFPYIKDSIMIAGWGDIWTKVKNTEEGFIYSGKPTWDPDKTLQPACHDLALPGVN